MSEHISELGLDRVPDTLSSQAFEELRTTIEALFLSAGREAGWDLLQELINGVTDDGHETSPALDGFQAYELAMACRDYFPEHYRTYFSGVQQAVDRDAIVRLQPETLVTIFDGTGILQGKLKDTPTVVCTPHSPFMLNLTLSNEYGESVTRSVLLGTIMIH